VNLKAAAEVLALFAVFSAAAVSVAELHPIIEIETDYFFGASENEKWIKAEQAAESVSKKRLTKSTA